MSRYDEPCNEELFPVLKSANKILGELAVTLASHGIEFWFEMGASTVKAASVPFTFARMWAQLESLRDAYMQMHDDDKAQKILDMQEILSAAMGCRASLSNEKINKHYGLPAEIEKRLEERAWVDDALKGKPWDDEWNKQTGWQNKKPDRPDDPFAGVVKT